MIFHFNFAQSFFVEPNFKGLTTLKIAGLDLFFKYKPDSTNNRSGILNPGMSLYLTDTIFDVPKITPDTFTHVARVEWAQIITSSDATVPTHFTFQAPVEIQTGKLYAFVVAFDGNETFWPWSAKIGSRLVGTNQIYNGPAGNFIGNYYEYVSTDPTADPTTATSQAQYTKYWRSLTDTIVKFRIQIPQFFIQGSPITVAKAMFDPSVVVHEGGYPQNSTGNNNLEYIIPSPNYEQITFDLANSSIMTFIGAQKVYQNTVFWPGGFANGANAVTISTTQGSNVVTANTNYPNGTAFNWNTVFGGYTGQKYVVIHDTTLRNVRLVKSILSNTVIQVTEPVTFTNAIAKFKIAPIATIDSLDTSSPRGKRTEFMRLRDSNANSSVRFVNNCIESVAITVGGTGYNNSDVLYVKGFQNVANKVQGGYVAVANIGTNSTGGITNVYMSNIGCGFVNNATIVATVANSTNIGNTTSNTSGGSGATFTYSVGATLRTELTENTFKNCQVINLDINDITPFFDVFSPSGTTFDLEFRSQYYIQSDNTTFDGFVYYVFPGQQEFDNLQLMNRNRLLSDKVPCFMSYSNEFKALYANGSQNDQANALSVVSNNIILVVNTTSNNDFIVVDVNTAPTVEFGKYIINNDYTNEQTNSGNCYAKHITTRNNFARLSEDIRVYLDAYKPANTDIQVFARIQNSGDPEAFDDEDWTRLTLVDGINVLSSLANETDYIELTYAFQQYPNTQFTLSGTISTSNNSNAIVGVSTTFAANLTVHDMVRIYDPLFPANNFIVATVGTITDNTHITIDQPILSTINPALVASGLRMEKLQFPHQAYLNITNDNVVRYYNTSTVKYDGYDNLQIKVCLLSSQLLHYPRIHDIRVVGVSA